MFPVPLASSPMRTMVAYSFTLAEKKLDGSGYPQGLQESEIPVQSKMMTISDIYDALRAGDRPYKRAVKPEKALDILADDVKKGRLDGDLLKVFIESHIWDSSEYLERLKDRRGE